MLSPIAIDRSSRREALQQLIEQGRQRLQSGFSIVIFPEGTRIAPGRRGKYRPGGARLAVQTSTLVLPVAHNAGEVWPKKAFVKRPGTVTVSIGPAIDSRDKSAAEITRQVEAWIEAEMARLPPAAAR
jgi:1-acyl-sn-glycerol-3-phosphate acyltransferase